MSWPRSVAVCALMLSLACAPGAFRHGWSAWAARLGDPSHVVLDAVTAAGTPVGVRARLAYGRVHKDLENEWVSFALRDGERIERIGRAISDDDGVAEIVIPGERLAAPGRHAVEVTVEGDGSQALGAVWVLEPGAAVAIFDLDGTLTTGDTVRRALFGVAMTVRPGAVERVRRHVEEGAQPVYLTGRSFIFDRTTRRWLAEAGFASGPLIFSREIASGAPWHDIDDYKAAWLAKLVATVGPDVRAAYGDGESDACAYARAGIPPQRTFLVDGEAEGCPGFEPPRVIDGFEPAD